MIAIKYSEWSESEGKERFFWFYFLRENFYIIFLIRSFARCFIFISFSRSSIHPFIHPTIYPTNQPTIRIYMFPDIQNELKHAMWFLYFNKYIFLSISNEREGWFSCSVWMWKKKTMDGWIERREGWLLVFWSVFISIFFYFFTILCMWDDVWLICFVFS